MTTAASGDPEPLFVMKILAVGSHIIDDPTKQSQVDWWRIGRPLQELAKHVDWQIDHEPSFIPGFAKYKNLDEFTEEEMNKAFKKICQYDIVFASYHPDPTAYTMLKVARDKAGTQFVMDCDDDMFAINPDNPFWMKMDDEKVYWMQRMIADNDWITTPSEILADRFRKRRTGQHKDTVTVVPNYIADCYKEQKPDNGKEIVIGYCGGSSHYADLHETGVLEAIQKIMHENKNVRFKSVGMLVDTYLPKQRMQFDGGKRGRLFWEEIFPTLNFDIAIGPLLDNIFNRGKSNIKWQEMTRAGAAFVASNIGPYASLPKGAATVIPNGTEFWYEALKELVDNPEKRQQMVDAARKELVQWRLENNWKKYKALFEKVKGIQDENSTPRKNTIILPS